MTVIRSRDNARIKSWHSLAQEPGERRKRGRALIEGVHLVETFLQQEGVPVSLIVSESAVGEEEVDRLVQRSRAEPFILADNLFKRISDTQAPVGIALEISIAEQTIDPATSKGCVFLDRVQDAGNVGAIIRSAAAFGVPDVVVGRGCADPWSPKALRAGMGGHFFLRVAASSDLNEDIRRFGGDSICTAVHEGEPLGALDLTGRIAWIFGSEGSGVSAGVAAAASRKATIPTPGDTESLNVAASAAICFYERQRQLNTRGGGA